MLWRGARRRCPWCAGRKAFFTGWFRKQERCRTCEISWRRGDEGFELGALAISAVLVLGLLVVAMTIGIVATLPDVQVLTLLAILGVGAVVLPILLYPVSYTLWQGVDLAMRPPTPGDGTPPSR